MKSKSYFNKWWLMLVQGALLILLSYFLFSQPGKLVSTSATIAGFIALLTGSVSLIGYFLAAKNEKNRVELFSGFFSCLAGLFFLSGTGLAHELVSWFFAAFMVLNTLLIVSTSLQLKTEISWWWISILLLLYSIVIIYLFITGKVFFNISIAVFAAVQFFVSGILMIPLAFVVRNLQLEYSKTISQVRDAK